MKLGHFHEKEIFGSFILNGSIFEIKQAGSFYKFGSKFDLYSINIISHCVYFSRECNDPRKYHLLHNSYIILTLITHSKHVFFRLGKGVVGQKFTTVYTQPSY